MMDRSKLSTARRLNWIWLSLLWLACGWFSGCAKPPEITTTDASPTATPDQGDNPISDTPAAAVRDYQSRLLDVYTKLDAYRDRTVMKVTYRFDDGRTEVNTTTIDTQFARPNRLRLSVASEDNRVTIVSDGEKTEARIIDPVTQNFDGQVVLQSTNSKLTLNDIYRATELVDPLSPDERVSALMGTPTGLDMIPLGLVLGEGRLAELSASATAAGSQDGFQILESKATEGSYQFWVDSESGLVNRIQFPATKSNLPPGLASIELVADCSEVATTVDDDALQLSEEGQHVSHFVMPPLPPATDLLGKKISPFEVENESGVKSRIDNDDKSSTVITWFHDHPSSRMVMDQLEMVRARREGPKVRFVAVQLGGAGPVLSKWNINAKAWLDTKAMGRDRLNITQAPTTVVLGPENVLHHFSVGANPNIGNDVAVVLERLLGGQDVAAETQRMLQQSREAYQRQLSLARADGLTGSATGDASGDASGAGWVEELSAEVPQATQPQRLNLAKKWTITELSEPGNMLIVPRAPQQCLITDGWNHVAFIDSTGKLLKRIKLELPEDEGITLLRAGKNSKERALYAAASRGGRRAFIFDFGGKLLMQYPRISGTQLALSDLAFGDLNGDNGTELLVGWQGDYGTHAVELGGKQLWTNRAMRGVVSVGIAEDENRRMTTLVAGELGSLVLIDGTGRTLRELSPGGRTVHQAVAWPGSARGFQSLIGRASISSGDESAVCCCLSLAANGGTSVIGVNAAWEPVWEHVLPPGVYRHQVDAVQSMDLPEVGATWVFAGSDGSVHFVSADGKFRDSFFTGKHLRGVASLSNGEVPTLLLATDGELNAYDVTEKK